MTGTDDLARDLGAAAPGLDALHREHLEDYDELLPHVFLGDVTRWLTTGAPGPAAASVLAVLERHWTAGDEAVRNAIAVSFLENLEPGDAAVRAALGPGLQAELLAIESWMPEHPDRPT